MVQYGKKNRHIKYKVNKVLLNDMHSEALMLTAILRNSVTCAFHRLGRIYEIFIRFLRVCTKLLTKYLRGSELDSQTNIYSTIAIARLIKHVGQLRNNLIQKHVAPVLFHGL